MATQTPQQRRAAARKAAATRKRNQTRRRTAQTKRQTQATATSAERTAENGVAYALERSKAAVDQAQRVALIPVGATLVARDNVVDAVKPFVASRTSAERELNKLGRSFSDAVAEKAGIETLNRVWEGPEALPNLAELSRPATWLERIERAAATPA